MDVDVAVARLGGTCTWRQLRTLVSWRSVGAALADGSVVRIARGRYAVPAAEEGRVAAGRLSATASHTTAALHWGWKVKTTPACPHVTLPRHRKLRAGARDGVTLHWRDLPERHVADGWVTSPVRTVIDCCLDLPFDEALAVFDSAWRAGLRPHAVQEAALTLSRNQRSRVLAVARAADRGAANPFESVLRAIALEEGLGVACQVVIRDGGFYARVDLADEELRIVLEADSFEFHGERRALDRDCRRYDELVVRDWIVLRFSWEQVMFQPEFVRAMIRGAMALRGRRTGTKAVKRVKTA